MNQTYSRASAPELDAVLGHKFPVLDDGFVVPVDYLGNDNAIVQAARVSYGAGTKKVHEDRGLIRYLMRHRHTTPFEMCEIKFHVRVPMDCWRQWIRHRTACLTGDVPLQFDLPGGIARCGNQLYTKTVAEIYQAFQPTENTQRPDKQRNSFHKKDRIQNMHLRSINEDTGEIYHTKIVDIWTTGKKRVYEVTFDNGSVVTMSEDHLCYTTNGWKTLREAAEIRWIGGSIVHDGSLEFDENDMNYISNDNIRLTSWEQKVDGFISVGPGKDNGVPAHQNSIDEATENWLPVIGWESYYEVSDQGRVRRIIGGKGSRSYGRCKKLTKVPGNHFLVSLNRPGEQVTKLVHQLVLEAFVGQCPDGMICRHLDGNGLNNHVENLAWATQQDNANDRIRDDATTQLRTNVINIVSIKYRGQEETYDIEVEGPFHNFSANGIIVHNSVNEYSTRYSEAIDSCQVTPRDKWRKQSTANKQGSGDFISPDRGIFLSGQEEDLHKKAHEIYNHRLKEGVAREQARKDLPLSTYTEAYWKIDLHNLFHFLSLRMDSHAQFEIRQYANQIGEIVRLWVPFAWEAFEDYRLGGMFLSAQEQKIIADVLDGGFKPNLSDNLSKREQEELEEKMGRLGL